jgi:hypothetical protein
LRKQGFWGTNAKAASAGNTGRFKWSTTRSELVMSNAKIAPLCGARKWYTAYSQRKNSFYNLNDSPRLGFERPWLYVVPLGFIAGPRAILYAQSVTI